MQINMFFFLTYYLMNWGDLFVHLTIGCVIKTEPSHIAHLSLFQISRAHTNKCIHSHTHSVMIRRLGKRRSTWLPAVVIFVSFSGLCQLTRWPSLWKHLGCYSCWMAPLFLHSSVVWTLLWFPWLIITEAMWAFFGGSQKCLPGL